MEQDITYQEKLSAFWKDSDVLIQHAPTGHLLRDIAKFDVIVKEDCLPEQLLDSVEQDKKVT